MATQDSAGWRNKQEEIRNELELLGEQLPSINSLLDQYNTILSKTNDEQVRLSMGLGKVLAVQEQYTTQVTALTKNITWLEQRNAALNKSYGVGRIAAEKYAKQLRTLAIATEISSEKLMQYSKDLKGLTGGMLFAGDATTGFRKKLVLTQQFLQNNLKVSQQAAEGYEYYAATIADSGAEAATVHEQLSKTIASATGMDALQLQRDLTEDIGGLSADLQMRYSRIPGSIELAVLKSRALGTTLEGLNNAGESLLNIESSIGSELEYQLLSGKRLLTQDGKSLTNAYRMATIQGDANKQAELMDQFLKDQGPMLEKNLFARKKAAELMGTDEATLARMLQQQKIMSKLGVEKLMKLNQNDIGAVVAKLRKDGVDEEKIQSLIKSTDTRTTAEIANDYLKSIDEKTINEAGVDVGTASAKALDGAKAFETAMTMFSSKETIKAFGEVARFGETVTALTDPMTDLIGVIPGFGATIKDFVNGIVGLVPKLSSATIGTGTTTVTAEQDALVMNDGIIKFHQDDKFMRVNDSTMIAGTNVDGNRQLARAISGGGGGSIDYMKMAQAIAAAMSNVNLVVKMERDIYAPSTLNPIGKRI
jgi:hypothetical protein